MKSASAGFQTLADDMPHVTLDATSFFTSSWPAMLKLDVPEASSKGKIYRVLEPVQCVTFATIQSSRSTLSLFSEGHGVQLGASNLMYEGFQSFGALQMKYCSTVLLNS